VRGAGDSKARRKDGKKLRESTVRKGHAKQSAASGRGKNRDRRNSEKARWEKTSTRKGSLSDSQGRADPQGREILDGLTQSRRAEKVTYTITKTLDLRPRGKRGRFRHHANKAEGEFLETYGGSDEGSSRTHQTVLELIHLQKE